MCDDVDFHEPGEKISYSNFDLDTDELDCYSSACEDDESESIGTSEDEESSVFEPYVPEPKPSDCGESGDIDISEYNSSSVPEDKLVNSPDVDGAEDSPVEHTDDGFKGFDEHEIKDNRVLVLFEKFRESKCLCVDQIKEEEGIVGEEIISSPRGRLGEEDIKEEDGGATAPLPQQVHEEIKDEEGTAESREIICSTTPTVREAKNKAKSVMLELKEVYGEGGQDIGSDDQNYNGRDDHDDEENILLDYGLDKQRKSVGKEADIENQRRGLWSCDQCDFRTNYKRVINKHRWTHKLGGDCFKCSICSLKFKNAIRLQSHVEKEHPDQTCVRQETQTENLCSICDLQFEDSRSLYAHVKKKHSNKYFYKCALCNHTTTNNRSYRNHMMTHHPDSHVCPHCDYSTNRGSSYKTHIMQHTGEKPYACPHCPYRARQYPHLKQHLLFHMNLKPYECNICDFKTRQKSHLTKHLQCVHCNDKPFKCSVCEFTAKSKRTRDLHYISQHTNNKPYACKLCPFKSPHVNVLVDHKKGHGADLEYPCPECTWSAKTSLTQSHHVSGCHPGSKWVKNCPECDFSTIDVTSLRNHLKTKHGVSMHTNALAVQLPLKA